ncbi:MAG: translocation/assembly module TamB domain-containing protein [Planctomycetes bacterium]|nr:translocation/assembly module TamB domain-containing protein [Planctomycetota bacterium]
MRRIARILLGAGLVVAILIEVAWLASGPLFEHVLAPKIASALGESLDARVELRGLRGNLLGSAGLAHLSVLEGKRGIERIEGLEVEADYDLWGLIRGAPAAIRVVRCTAERVVIDLDAFPQSESDASPSSEPDIGAILDLLPHAAAVRIGDLAVRRQGNEYGGRLDATLARGDDGTTDVHLEFPATLVRATVNRPPGGAPRVDWRMSIRDTSRLSTLVLPRDGQIAGRVRLEGNARLAPPWTLQTTLELAGAGLRRAATRLDGAPLPDARLRARLDAEGVLAAELDADGPGLHVRARDVRIPLATIDTSSLEATIRSLREHSGALSMRVDDNNPWLALFLRERGESIDSHLTTMIEELRPWSLSLDARLLSGTAELDTFRLDGRGTHVHLNSSELALEKPGPNTSGRIDFRADLDATSPVSSMLGEDLRCEVLSTRGALEFAGGNLSTNLSVDSRLFRGRESIDGAGTITGTLTDPLDFDDERPMSWELRPDLRVSGTFVESATRHSSPIVLSGELRGPSVAGSIQTADPISRIDARELAIEQSGTVRLLVDGTIDEASDIDGLAAAAKATNARIRLTRLNLASARAFLPESMTRRDELGGNVAGAITWDPTSGKLDVQLDGSVTGIAPDAVAVRIRSEGTDRDKAACRIAVQTSGNEVSLNLRANELGSFELIDLLESGEDPVTALDHASIAMDLDLAMEDLSRLDLEKRLPTLGLDMLSGSVTGRVTVRGTSAAPELNGRVETRDVAVKIRDSVSITGVTGALLAEKDALRIDDFAFLVDGKPHLVRAAASRAEETVRLDSLEYLQDGRTTLRLSAGMQTAEFDRAIASLRAGESLEIGTLLDAISARLDVEAFDPRPFLEAGASAEVGSYVPKSIDAVVNLASARVDGTLRCELDEPLGGKPIEVSGRVQGDEKAFGVEDLAVKATTEIARGHAMLGIGLRDLITGATPVTDANVDALLEFDDFDLRSIPPATAGLEDLSGTVDGRLVVSGSVATPEPKLNLTIRDAAVRAAAAPRIDAIEGTIAVHPQAIRIERLDAMMGAAPLGVRGEFKTPRSMLESLDGGTVDFSIEGKNTLLWRKDGVRIRADLALQATGPVDAIQIGGTVQLDNSKVVGRIPFIDVGRTGGVAVREGIGIEGLSLPDGIGGRIAVDITTKKPIDVKTNVFQGGITTALSVEGTLRDPLILGTISSVPRKDVDARLKLPGIELRVSTLLVTFDRQSPRFPQINIVASGRRHGFDVTMSVRGRYDRPEVLMSSNPPLPAEDLAVLVATGTRPEQLRNSGARGVGTVVGSYVVEELADWLFGSESTEARESFVERFSILTGTEISSNGNESIVVEFRAMPRVWLQGERDVYEDVNFGIVYRLRFR